MEKPDIHLYLVISGKNEEIEKLGKEIEAYNHIKIFNKLKNEELLRMYKQSIGLLAPMRHCLQDEARFPQKVAEYCASGSPVITNPIGEIKTFFTSGTNAIFAKDFTINAYTDAMQWVINNPDKAHEIGLNGRQIGYKNFHYQNIAKPFAHFLLSL